MLANGGRGRFNKGRLHTTNRAFGSLVESVLRMRHGIVGNGQGAVFYEKRPVSESVYRQLLEIELRALQKTGRLQQMLKEKP